jgi:hypothetical protein
MDDNEEFKYGDDNNNIFDPESIHNQEYYHSNHNEESKE